MRAAELFAQFRNVLDRHHVDCRGMSAQEIAQVLTEKPWGTIEPVLAFLDTYSSVRFGGRPLSRVNYREMLRMVRALRPART